MATVFDYSAFLLADRVMRLFQDQAESHALFMAERKVRQRDLAGAKEWRDIAAAIEQLRGRKPKSASPAAAGLGSHDEEKIVIFVKPVDRVCVSL